MSCTFKNCRRKDVFGLFLFIIYSGTVSISVGADTADRCFLSQYESAAASSYCSNQPSYWDRHQCAEKEARSSCGAETANEEYLPIDIVQPQYPRRALSRGMTGWVLLEFTVNTQGSVEDVIVIDNCGWVKNARKSGVCNSSPNNVFNKAAIKAAQKFRYRPKTTVDGEPIYTPGVRNMITFELLSR